MSNISPKLQVSVNKNPSKQGVKVQFVLPQVPPGDEKSAITQKLQAKLIAGIGKFGLNPNIDTDVPLENTIGFFIRIEDIRLMIKNALEGKPLESEV